MYDDVIYCIKDAVSIAAPVIALFLAWKGLSTWRAQLKGSYEYDLAKRIMLTTYLVQEEIKSVRKPILKFSQEELDEKGRFTVYVDIYEARLEILAKKIAELNAIRLEIKVVYGQEAFNLFSELYGDIGKLRGSILICLRSLMDDSDPRKPIYPQELIDSSYDIADYASDDDEFSLKVALSVKNIEDFFKDKLHK